MNSYSFENRTHWMIELLWNDRHFIATFKNSLINFISFCPWLGVLYSINGLIEIRKWRRGKPSKLPQANHISRNEGFKTQPCQLTNADETAPTSAPQPIAAEGATAITTWNIIPRSGLPLFPPFDPLSNRASLGLQWRKWRRRFENFAWVRPYYPQRPTRRGRWRGHKWHPLYFARLGIDYNTAIETRGVGTPHM